MVVVCIERERGKELVPLSQERREMPSAVCVGAPVQIAERWSIVWDIKQRRDETKMF